MSDKEKMIDDIVAMLDGSIKKGDGHINLKVDEKSLNYERLLTHVKFLLQRVYRNEMLKDEDLLIIQTIKRQCEKEFDCCRKISSSIKEATGRELTEAEMVYMAIHIRRLLNTNKE